MIGKRSSLALRLVSVVSSRLLCVRCFVERDSICHVNNAKYDINDHIFKFNTTSGS